MFCHTFSPWWLLQIVWLCGTDVLAECPSCSSSFNKCKWWWMVDQGLVHTYKGIFTPLFEKKKSCHVKTQKHAMKHCQEHATPTGGDITLTVKHVGQSEAWKMGTLWRHDPKSPVSPATQQHCNRSFWKSSPWQEFSKMFQIVCMWKKWPKRIKIAAVLKIPVFVWTGPKIQ